MLCTQSKVLEVGSLIAWNLSRSSNLQKGVPSLEIDAVVRADSS